MAEGGGSHRLDAPVVEEVEVKCTGEVGSVLVIVFKDRPQKLLHIGRQKSAVFHFQQQPEKSHIIVAGQGERLALGPAEGSLGLLHAAGQQRQSGTLPADSGGQGLRKECGQLLLEFLRRRTDGRGLVTLTDQNQRLVVQEQKRRNGKRQQKGVELMA